MRALEILFVLAVAASRGEDVSHDARRLLIADNVTYAAAGAALAAGVHTARDDWRRDLRGEWFIAAPSDVTDVYGSGSFNLPAAVGLSWAGRITGRPGLRRLGDGLSRTLVLTQLVVGPAKLVTRRRRPDGSDRYSLPSGHTANTFAVARYLQRRYGTRAALLPYALGVTTAVGRVEGGRHYLSDVIMGATVGLIVGSAVDGGGDPRVHVSPLRSPEGLVASVSL